jgi:hypothetical protein
MSFQVWTVLSFAEAGENQIHVVGTSSVCHGQLQ